MLELGDKVKYHNISITVFNSTYAISQYNDNQNLTYLVSYYNNYILYIYISTL